MPTIQSIELPKPKNWQDFETMVCAAMSQRWNSPDMQKNGRPGQGQNGVDIYGPDAIGRKVGVQCKRVKESLNMKLVAAEIAAAETFEGHLSTLYIATTSDYDSVLQKDVRLLSDIRVAEGKFAVSLIFWEEVINGLILNPAVFKAHYPQITLPAPVGGRERQLAALELGYYGAELWDYVVLVFGEIGWMTQTDPDSLVATLRAIERRTGQLLPPEDAAPILEALTKVREGCLAPKKKKSDWDPVEVQAKRVETRITAASSLLPPEEARVLELAMQLGRIYHHSDDPPSASVQKQIESRANLLFPASSVAIRKRFSAAKKLTSGYSWAQRIYNLIAHELRWAAD
ncbi:hypothetical protein [Mesorhizobium sp. 10J20-29]